MIDMLKGEDQYGEPRPMQVWLPRSTTMTVITSHGGSRAALRQASTASPATKLDYLTSYEKGK